MAGEEGLGKRGYLENGGDIIFVTAPSSGGKSTFIKDIKNFAINNGVPETEVRVITDGTYLYESVLLAEKEFNNEERKEPGFYWKRDEKGGINGFVITDQKILERAYRNFFKYIAEQEYTGYPIFVEWAGGMKNKDMDFKGDTDCSYKTIGKILMELYGEKIMPRVRAVLNLATGKTVRKEWQKLRTGEGEARGQTVSDLFDINDFNFNKKFPEEKVFPIHLWWGFSENEIQKSPVTANFLRNLFFPFISLAEEASRHQPRTEIHDGMNESKFFDNYKQLTESFLALEISRISEREGLNLSGEEIYSYVESILDQRRKKGGDIGMS